MKRLKILFILSVLAPGISCAADEASSGSDAPGLTPVVMQFDWIFNAQFAGFYQAVDQGYFEEAGLEVELRGGATTPHTVSATLEEPKVSFGSAESNVLIGDAAEGANLKLIGTMFQDSPMGWMFPASDEIEVFTDLADKRVGIHADGARVIRLLLAEQGADLSELETYDCGYDPAIVIEGEADAMQCYYIDEFVRLEQLIGDRARVFLAKDYGYEAYSQVMFTSSETVANHPKVVEAFLDAVKRGWAYAFAHPEETVDLILSKYNAELEREYQLRSLAKIKELMIPEPGALLRPMEPEVLKAGQDRLLKYDLIEGEVDIDALLAQQFLPRTDKE